MELLIKLGLFLLLVVIGYWRGSRNERQHLKWLAEQERQLTDVLVFATRYPPPAAGRVMDPVLVTGAVVVGSDFFRLMVAALRKVVGGNYRSYEKLMDRGRRHALIKLKTHARERGARMVFNVRYTCSVGIPKARQGHAAQIEVLAYGTAYVLAAGSVAQSLVHHQPGVHITAHDQTDLMKNPVSRWWVIGWFAGVVYCFVELTTDSRWPHAWRYISGAPWWLFGALALAATAWLVRSGRKHRLGWPENIFLAVLTAPLLAFMLYFGALRINGATAVVVSVRYELQSDLSLRPAAPGSAASTLRFDNYRDYWAAQKTGVQADIVIARGWLGFTQYDLNSLRERYRAYYQGQGQRDRSKP